MRFFLKGPQVHGNVGRPVIAASAPARAIAESSGLLCCPCLTGLKGDQTNSTFFLGGSPTKDTDPGV